ncbi:hypothetical protein HDU98_005907, partial [Podochytrium sp. JEL0797]
MSTNDNTTTIDLLKGPLNASTWYRDFMGLAAKNKYDHCINPKYYNEVPGIHGNRRLAGQALASALADDPERKNHAFIDNQTVFALHPTTPNKDSAFPGNLRENAALILLLNQSLDKTIQLAMVSNAICAYAQLQQVMARVTTLNPTTVKILCKNLGNWQME